MVLGILTQIEVDVEWQSLLGGGSTGYFDLKKMAVRLEPSGINGIYGIVDPYFLDSGNGGILRYVAHIKTYLVGALPRQRSV